MLRRQSTLEYFVQWQGFNAEDYTWEKEKDVIGGGSQAGANELVEAYWNRLRHLESRRVVVEEQTASISPLARQFECNGVWIFVRGRRWARAC